MTVKNVTLLLCCMFLKLKISMKQYIDKLVMQMLDQPCTKEYASKIALTLLTPKIIHSTPLQQQSIKPLKQPTITLSREIELQDHLQLVYVTDADMTYCAPAQVLEELQLQFNPDGVN